MAYMAAAMLAAAMGAAPHQCAPSPASCYYNEAGPAFGAAVGGLTAAPRGAGAAACDPEGWRVKEACDAACPLRIVITAPTELQMTICAQDNAFEPYEPAAHINQAHPLLRRPLKFVPQFASRAARDAAMAGAVPNALPPCIPTKRQLAAVGGAAGRVVVLEQMTEDSCADYDRIISLEQGRPAAAVVVKAEVAQGLPEQLVADPMGRFSSGLVVMNVTAPLGMVGSGPAPPASAPPAAPSVTIPRHYRSALLGALYNGTKVEGHFDYTCAPLPDSNSSAEEVDCPAGALIAPARDAVSACHDERDSPRRLCTRCPVEMTTGAEGVFLGCLWGNLLHPRAPRHALRAPFPPQRRLVVAPPDADPCNATTFATPAYRGELVAFLAPAACLPYEAVLTAQAAGAAGAVMMTRPAAGDATPPAAAVLVDGLGQFVNIPVHSTTWYHTEDVLKLRGGAAGPVALTVGLRAGAMPAATPPPLPPPQAEDGALQWTAALVLPTAFGTVFLVLVVATAASTRRVRVDGAPPRASVPLSAASTALSLSVLLPVAVVAFVLASVAGGDATADAVRVGGDAVGRTVTAGRKTVEVLSGTVRRTALRQAVRGVRGVLVRGEEAAAAAAALYLSYNETWEGCDARYNDLVERSRQSEFSLSFLGAAAPPVAGSNHTWFTDAVVPQTCYASEHLRTSRVLGALGGDLNMVEWAAQEYNTTARANAPAGLKLARGHALAGRVGTPLTPFLKASVALSAEYIPQWIRDLRGSSPGFGLFSGLWVRPTGGVFGGFPPSNREYVRNETRYIEYLRDLRANMITYKYDPASQVGGTKGINRHAFVAKLPPQGMRWHVTHETQSPLSLEAWRIHRDEPLHRVLAVYTPVYSRERPGHYLGVAGARVGVDVVMRALAAAQVEGTTVVVFDPATQLLLGGSRGGYVRRTTQYHNKRIDFRPPGENFAVGNPGHGRRQSVLGGWACPWPSNNYNNVEKDAECAVRDIHIVRSYHVNEASLTLANAPEVELNALGAYLSEQPDPADHSGRFNVTGARGYYRPAAATAYVAHIAPKPHAPAAAVQLTTRYSTRVAARSGRIADGYEGGFPAGTRNAVTVEGDDCRITWRTFDLPEGIDSSGSPTERCAGYRRTSWKATFVRVHGLGAASGDKQTYCGGDLPAPVQVWGRGFTVEFKTGYASAAHAGFELDFECRPAQPPHAPHNVSLTAREGGAVYAASGRITDGYGGGTYLGNIPAAVTVYGANCRVRWARLDLPASRWGGCGDAYVLLRHHGNMLMDPEAFSERIRRFRHCGQELPPPSQTFARGFTVEFHTAGFTEEGRGFELEFECGVPAAMGVHLTPFGNQTTLQAASGRITDGFGPGEEFMFSSSGVHGAVTVDGDACSIAWRDLDVRETGGRGRRWKDGPDAARECGESYVELMDDDWGSVGRYCNAAPPPSLIHLKGRQFTVIFSQKFQRLDPALQRGFTLDFACGGTPLPSGIGVLQSGPAVLSLRDDDGRGVRAASGRIVDGYGGGDAAAEAVHAVTVYGRNCQVKYGIGTPYTCYSGGRRRDPQVVIVGGGGGCYGQQLWGDNFAVELWTGEDGMTAGDGRVDVNFTCGDAVLDGVEELPAGATVRVNGTRDVVARPGDRGTIAGAAADGRVTVFGRDCVITWLRRVHCRDAHVTIVSEDSLLEGFARQGCAYDEPPLWDPEFGERQWNPNRHLKDVQQLRGDGFTLTFTRRGRGDDRAGQGGATGETAFEFDFVCGDPRAPPPPPPPAPAAAPPLLGYTFSDVGDGQYETELLPRWRCPPELGGCVVSDDTLGLPVVVFDGGAVLYVYNNLTLASPEVAATRAAPRADGGWASSWAPYNNTMTVRGTEGRTSQQCVEHTPWVGLDGKPAYAGVLQGRPRRPSWGAFEDKASYWSHQDLDRQCMQRNVWINGPHTVSVRYRPDALGDGWLLDAPGQLGSAFRLLENAALQVETGVMACMTKGLDDAVRRRMGWTTATAVVDLSARECRVYVNGTLHDTAPLVLPRRLRTFALVAPPAVGGNGFRGRIAEVAVLNTSATAAEAAGLHATGLFKREVVPREWWAETAPVGGGVGWAAAALMPEEEVMRLLTAHAQETGAEMAVGEANRRTRLRQRAAETVVLLAALIAFGTYLFLVFNEYLTRPFADAARVMGLAAAMDIREVPQHDSRIDELRVMYFSMGRLMNSIEGFRPFLPDALFRGTAFSLAKARVDTAPGLSTGMACLAFTDIVSSTKTWAGCPDGMRKGLKIHNAVMRAAIAACGGYEVKTVGDAFMVAFELASGGVRFALAAQAKLYEQAWPGDLLAFETCVEDEAQHWRGIRVRIGIHFGEVDVEFNPVLCRYDYFGSTVNRAARTEAACVPGMVAVTPSVLEELRNEGGGDTLWRADGGGGDRVWAGPPLDAAVVALERPGVTMNGFAGDITLHMLLPEALQGRANFAREWLRAKASAATAAPPPPKTENPLRALDADRYTPGRPASAESAETALRPVRQGVFARLRFSFERGVMEGAEASAPLHAMIGKVLNGLSHVGGALLTVESTSVLVSFNVAKEVTRPVDKALRYVSMVHQSCFGVSKVSGLHHLAAGVCFGDGLYGHIGSRRQKFITACAPAVAVADVLAQMAGSLGTVCLLGIPAGRHEGASKDEVVPATSAQTRPIDTMVSATDAALRWRVEEVRTETAADVPGARGGALAAAMVDVSEGEWGWGALYEAAYAHKDHEEITRETCDPLLLRVAENLRTNRSFALPILCEGPPPLPALVQKDSTEF